MKAAINDHYREISLQTGAGSFNLSGVEILSVEENIVTAVIDGYHKNRSLPKLETSELKDTLLFIMENTKKGYRVIGVREKSKAK